MSETNGQTNANGTRTVTIYGAQFTYRETYRVEGGQFQVLTNGEWTAVSPDQIATLCAVVNQTMSQNLSNNFRPNVRDALLKEGIITQEQYDEKKAPNDAATKLSVDAKAALAQEFATEVDEYEFGGTGGPRGPRDPDKDYAIQWMLTKMAARVAREGGSNTKTEMLKHVTARYAEQPDHWKEMALAARARDKGIEGL